MTVIAWDGNTLAADKQSTNVGHPSIVTKIYRVQDGLIGLAGNAAHAMALLHWFRGDRNPQAWPKPWHHDEVASVLHISTDGKISKYDGNAGPIPEVIESRFTAMGHGRDYALAIMHIGYGAEAAVLVASDLDVNCGMGIDSLTLDGEPVETAKLPRRRQKK